MEDIEFRLWAKNIGLSHRVKNVLIRHFGCECTLKQLLDTPVASLLLIKNFGKNSFLELEQALMRKVFLKEESLTLREHIEKLLEEDV